MSCDILCEEIRGCLAIQKKCRAISPISTCILPIEANATYNGNAGIAGIHSYVFNLYSALKILIKPYINVVLWISRNGCRIENCLQIVKI